MTNLGFLLSLCIYVLPFAFAHVQMSNPFPLRSSLDPETPYDLRDYDMMAPLNSDGSDYPCKGYHKDQSRGPTVTYRAGEQYSIQLAGSATHLGGSCQLSLSYDGGATFKVIKSMIGGCPLTQNYDFTIPAFAPGGTALFAWTWLNYEGNREFYMNCAPVEILGSSDSPVGSIDSLPNIWVANLAGVNTCTLPSAQNAVFPNPGDDVVYGEGMSSSSPPTPGDCDGSGDSGSGAPDAPPMDQYLPDSDSSDNSGQPGIFAEFGPASASTVSIPSSVVGGVATTPIPDASSTVSPLVELAPVSSMIGAESSTTLLEANGNSATVTSVPGLSTLSTQYTSAISTSATCTGPVASCDCLPGYTCSAIDVCSTICVVDSASSVPGISSSIASSSYSIPSLTTSTIQPSANQPSSSIIPSETGIPPYATGDPSAYLPCVPGRILCTATDAFLTCIPSSGTWTYGSSRTIADGMLCLPFLSPYTNQTIQFSNDPTLSPPSGSYRDDRYVRAQPYGRCEPDGEIECVDAGFGMGSGFLVCDQGGWVDMGRVANGTVCSEGEIVGV